MLEMDMDSDDRQHFHATLYQSELGPASVNIVHAGRHQIRRTPGAIARSRHAVMFLLQLRSGQFRVKQQGREADLKVGDCVLLNGSAPYHLVCPADTECLALRLPSDWLKAWLPNPEGLAGRPLQVVDGWSRALSAALSTFGAQSASDLSLPPSLVAEQLASLLALAAGGGSEKSIHRNTLFDRVMQTVRDRGHEPDFTPEVLALEHDVSRRYIHYLYAQHGSTFGEELIAVRLQRAERLLKDRRFDDVPIGEISARCGFTEPSHFARRFRQKFGQSPTRFRRSAVTDLSP